MPQFNHKLLVALALFLLSFIITFFLIKTGIISKMPIPLLSNSFPSPTPIKNIPNVLYPHNPDPSGRNIYYITNDLGKNIPYSGAGINFYSEGEKFLDEKGKTILTVSSSSAFTRYVVGSVDKWETIPDSQDRYLVLTDLLATRKLNSSVIPLPKIRIGFSTQRQDQNKQIFNTAMAVEDLSSIIPKVLNKTQGAQIYRLGLAGNLNPQDLDKMILPGDAVAVTFIPNLQKKQDLVDKNNVKVASWLFIRRFDPQKTLTQELGKTINLQP